MNNNHQADNKRILKNTLYLYFRSFIILCISLYTSRVVLAVLGFEDHGIYNLVGGVVGMFSMFSSTFLASTQRFLNIEIGKKNFSKSQEVFSASINIHLFISFVLLIFFETFGLWIINYKLNIPEGRIIATNIVYQLSIVTFIIKMISVPYDAVIIANEKMNVYAYVSIYEAVMKLVVISLLLLQFMDNLVLYSILYMIIPLSIRFFYGIYCKKRFIECTYIRVCNRSLYKEMLSISGWNFLNSSACIATSNGIGIVINLFSNVIVNSAKGIAGQVEGMVTQFYNNFMVSIRPQMTKSYAVGDNEYLLQLIERGTKYGFFLLSVFCVPLIIEAKSILHYWLGDIPPFTIEFVQLSLLFLLQHAFSTVLDILLMATGRLKYPQISLSILQILNIPFSCILLFFHFPPYSIYISYIVISYLTLFVRLYYSVHYSKLTYSFYFTKILKPLIKFIIISLFVLIPCYHFAGFYQSFFPMVFFMLISDFVICFLFYLLVLSNDERESIKNKIYKK